MKKFIYTAIALAAVAVGCTKSNIVDVPEVQKTPITFETYNGKTPVTKATDVTQATFEASTQEAPAFNVKAFKPNGEGYMNENVWCETKATESTKATWKYDGLTYWPGDGSSLTFAAYGLNAASNVSLSSDGKTLTYTVPANASSHADLVVATPVTQDATAGGTVSLEFKHVLSRVGFKLQTVGSGTSVTISEVSLNGKFVNNGTVNLATETAITPKAADLTAADYTTSYSLFADGEYFDITKEESAADGTPIFARYTSDGEGGSTTNTDNSDRYMMIMPGAVVDNDQSVDNEIGTKPYIQVTYKLGDGTLQTKKLPLVDESGENWDFAAGTAYEFIFKVSISAIEFTGEVVDWDEDIDGDGDVDEDDYID